MSLLPDLGETEKQSNLPVLTFSYDNTSEETDEAIRTFRKTFGSKRGWIMTAAYIVMMIAASVLLAFNPTQPVLYLALGLCVIFLVLTISAPSRRRKKLVKRIESMPPEDYVCELYSDKVIIKTYIREQDGVKVENPEPVIQLFPFRGEYLLDFDENNSAVLLFVNGSSFFCFPKRCLTEEQKAKLLEVLGKSVTEID
ncbi:MAG: YcxB family protein [Oscillospiraceae bacterium]